MTTTSPRSTLRRFVLGTLSASLSVVLLVVALPKVSHSSWDAVLDEVPQVQARFFALLLTLWIVGLYVHTVLLRAVLPGLRRRHAFALNLGGSCVSNVLPLGGAAGAALNWAMLSSWGFDRTSVLTFTTTTNLIVAAVKVAIAVAGLVALAEVPSLQGALPHAGTMLVITLCVLFVAALVIVYLARRPAADGAEGSHRGLRTVIHSVRTSAVSAVRSRWVTVMFGAFGYPMLQLALLDACLHAFGLHIPFWYAAVAYAADRVLTMVPITPGGAGVAETGMTAVLIALGFDPTASAAAVLLYRGFTYYIEIPIGGAVALGWAVRRGRARIAG